MKNPIKKLILTLVLTVTAILNFALVCSPAKAQETIDDRYKPAFASDLKLNKENTADTGNALFQMLSGSLIFIAGPVAILIIALGGFTYVTSRGNQAAVDKAKKTINNAVLGLVFIILSLVIVQNVIRLIVNTQPTTTTQTQSTGNP